MKNNIEFINEELQDQSQIEQKMNMQNKNSVLIHKIISQQISCLINQDSEENLNMKEQNSYDDEQQIYLMNYLSNLTQTEIEIEQQDISIQQKDVCITKKDISINQYDLSINQNDINTNQQDISLEELEITEQQVQGTEQQVQSKENFEQEKEIDIMTNYEEIQTPNFQFPSYRLKRLKNRLKQEVKYPHVINRKQLGIEMHEKIEKYLIKNYVNKSQDKNNKQIQKNYISSLGFFPKFYIDSVVYYLQVMKNLPNIKIEYSTTCTPLLVKRFDALFHNTNQYVIVDWKYSDYKIEQILAMDSAHFRDQMLEAVKQFNTLDITIIIVPLKILSGFTIQEITIQELLRFIENIPRVNSFIKQKYNLTLKKINNDQNNQLLLEQTQIGEGKKKKEKLFQTIENIIKHNSEKQIQYYLNTSSITSDHQPRNKDQYWIIHVFLNEILMNKNDQFKELLDKLDIQNKENIEKDKQKMKQNMQNLVQLEKNSIEVYPLGNNHLQFSNDSSMNYIRKTQERNYLIIKYTQDDHLQLI